MTKRQQARLHSYHATLRVFDRYPDETAAVPALVRAVGWVRDRVAEVDAAVSAQASYTPQSETKDARRQDLATAAVPVAQALAARADEAGDPSTAEQFDLHAWDFLGGPFRAALDRAGAVLAAAREAGDDLAEYGAETADVDALATAHTAFGEAASAPRDEIIEREPHTEAIETLIPAIGERLRKRVDRMMVRFAGTPFGQEYEAARAVVDPGTPGRGGA